MAYWKKFIVLVVLLVLIGGCAAQKKHKKLKPGKPIPCPLKDC
jgi:hypothetical protein